MNGQLPSPDFNREKYHRPNRPWECGWIKEGKSCPQGPDGRGNCRATFECKPLLENTPDGRRKYKCTRPAEQGGPCQRGPNPDGACSRAIPRCRPVRSLRGRRGVLVGGTLTATAALLLVLLYGPASASFISPGEISTPHTSVAFKMLNTPRSGRENDCAACHGAANVGPSGWLEKAVQAHPPPADWKALAAKTPPSMTRIDRACEHCHTGHSFHEPNVLWNHSCSACHREHLGAGPMKHNSAATCVTCHGEERVMEASAMKGTRIAAARFIFQRGTGQEMISLPRPDAGFTKIIHNFADHPDFQIHTDRAKDPDTLRFSHRAHAASNPAMPLVDKKKIDCAFCHQPDAHGAYYKKPSYAVSCQPCHSLQFDKNNSDLLIPHGDVAAAKSFLRSLPAQYREYGMRKKQITEKRALEQFVQEQLTQLRNNAGTVPELERRVFLSNEYKSPARGLARSANLSRALFPGCSYCHQVTSAGDQVAVTPPLIAERWMFRGRFDHVQHRSAKCTECHDVRNSTATSDILLPHKRVCTLCHSPEGGVRHDCTTCHSYHNQPANPRLRLPEEEVAAQ